MQLDLLILIRLAAKATPRSELVRSLRRFLAIDGSEGAIDAALTALVASGLVAQRPLRLTPNGFKRAHDALGVDAMPSWNHVWRRRLPALALGVPVDTDDELRAAVVAQRLIWALGRSQQLRELATTARQVLNLSATALQLEMVRQWVVAGRSKPEPSPTPEPPPPRPPLDFLDAVRDATTRVPAEGRFGADRVFISALWKQLDAGAAFPGLTLDAFKKRLLDANRTQQLTLARADMPGAMDRATVAASEIRHLNSTFHFVLDRSRL
jgi:hypothetical protein